jgi:hypothetical protein
LLSSPARPPTHLQSDHLQRRRRMRDKDPFVAERDKLEGLDTSSCS